MKKTGLPNRRNAGHTRSVLRLTLILLAGLAPPARAQDAVMTAGHLLEVCTTPSAHWIDFCNGFFQAVHDLGVGAGAICAPAGVTRTELVELYERSAGTLLREEPSLGDQPAVAVASAVLAQAMPCDRQ